MAVGFFQSVFMCFTFFGNLRNPIMAAMLPIAKQTSERRLEEPGSGNKEKSSCLMVLDPDRIPQAGVVNTFCFDKTGTLTGSGLDFVGVCYPAPVNTSRTTSTSTRQTVQRGPQDRLRALLSSRSDRAL